MIEKIREIYTKRLNPKIKYIRGREYWNVEGVSIPAPDSFGRWELNGNLWTIPFLMKKDGTLIDPGLRLKSALPKYKKRGFKHLLIRIDRFGSLGHYRFILKTKVADPNKLYLGVLCPITTPINSNIGDTIVLLDNYELEEDRIIVKSDRIFSDIPLSIPFLLNTHPNRATMGANYVTQSIPTPEYEPPIISTSVYEKWMDVDLSYEFNFADKPYYGRNLLIAITFHPDSYEDAFAYREDLNWVINDIVKVGVPKWGHLEVKVGDKVDVGDPLSTIPTSHPVGQPDKEKIGYIFSKLFNARRVLVRSSVSGTVMKISEIDNSYEITILKNHTLETGDKISSRYGNKGVIKKVSDLPVITDDRFPELKGRPVDMIISPESVLQRVTPSLLAELHASMLPYLDKSIPRRIIDPTIEFVMEKMKSLKFDGYVETNKGRMVIGFAYIIPTTHLAYKKLAYRGITGGWSGWHPTRGRSFRGGQRTGEMELWTLQAYDVDLFREFFKRSSYQNAYYILRNIALDRDISVNELDSDLSILELIYILQALGIHIKIMKEET